MNSRLNDLSEAALALFRLHAERRGQVVVGDENRAQYQELERAGLVLLSRPFTGPGVYRLTQEGFERKIELFGWEVVREGPPIRDHRSRAV